MVFKRLQDSQDSLYLQAMQLYQSSFPLHEQRKPDAQRAILKEPDYQFNLLMEEDHLMGGASLLGNAGIYLCRASVHSATAARQHCGSRALELLEQRGKPVILEIDPPIDDISLRRKGFYERAGYRENPFTHVHPPYREGFAGHPLVVMSYPRQLEREEYDRFYQYLCSVVMKTL